MPKLLGSPLHLKSTQDLNKLLASIDSPSLEIDLQGSVYSYALKQLGFSTDGQRTLIRLDVLLKTKKPGLERYFVVRGPFDHRRIVLLAREVLRGIEQQLFYPNPGWYCAECPFKSEVRSGALIN